MLALLKELRGRLNAAVVFVSHDLGLIGRMCDRVGVLYAGRLAETGPVGEVLAAPAHPYTAGLLVPVLGATRHDRPLRPVPGRLGRGTAAGLRRPGGLRLRTRVSVGEGQRQR
ncbi:hypothetical protein ACFWIO_05775 [Streptomyces diastatochromogenes]|uniref:hypothetical protein n=1 Tax=Streptomyces diastatochromogenes TaxID=42236 RepID=UPI0036491A27